MGVTHQKMGLWPKIHQWRRMVPLKTRFGVISPFFHLKGPLIFSGVMINWLKNFLKEKKVGVTYQIMAIWPIEHHTPLLFDVLPQPCWVEDCNEQGYRPFCTVEKMVTGKRIFPNRCAYDYWKCDQGKIGKEVGMVEEAGNCLDEEAEAQNVKSTH